MNLLDEPWLPVRDAQNRRHWAIRHGLPLMPTGRISMARWRSSPSACCKPQRLPGAPHSGAHGFGSHPIR